MCQSISIVAETAELTEKFQINQVLSYSSNRHERNTTESISVIIEEKNNRTLDDYRWGLVPFWAKDSVHMDSSELLQKPIFDRIVKKQRCIIPCSGFYLSRTEGKLTHRVKISMRSGTFAIAGLYDVFKPASGEEVRTCTMLMTAPNLMVAPYETRMPAILEPEDIDDWLKRDSRFPFELKAMLRPMDAMRMIAIPISTTRGDRVEFEAPRPKWI
ncbi:putative SOS response-associated peptidase YoqW [Paenibacillus baekrokdamisoli]|uniref:Abasic site processing protein n=1 Tax=Paenibacillus baekrokdamisoli TaxID=1712516 RepID=A0A3G9IWQ4_9BACL|nr:SOS response-associated peptidase family protein [Paenibacillus baekrokdamisoli]MBB3068236.1 putative SOS response-associated peptidase YedK [Paenibacillus baekrokdamisoli]BBH22722.1 putative SOS response-associated peptidase YoqW [Paenibacillus baekrokdamisoli]